MKNFFKILGVLLALIVLIIAGAIGYVKTALPNVGEAPQLNVEITPERVKRGEYLANCVTVCMDCHSTRDWSKFSGPLFEHTFGKGGERFDRNMGFPGVFYSKNITPAGIKDYTDGELYRVITSGVNKQGRALFPIMPYLNYGRMENEDIYSIIAYIRSLPAIENTSEEPVLDFPMNIIVNTIPKTGMHDLIADKSNTLKYGEYVANAAGCIECHTKQDKGNKLPGMEFAGGFEFKFPNGTIVRSANITPDKETGIGNWSKEAFVGRFKIYADSSYTPHNVKDGDFQTVMPWTMYSKMNQEDLEAIFEYLQTVAPVNNSVEKFTGI